MSIIIPNQDFIGFSYGDWHCIRDGHIYRVSDGSRYNTNPIPILTDKTADMVGNDGQIFFGSFYKNKSFTINFAFDSLTEDLYHNLSQVFNGKKIKELVFDEYPYKAYDAKVTGTPTLKIICFDDPNGNRVYKGEGSVQFTCSNPFAHTPSKLWTFSDGTYNYATLDGRDINNYNQNIYTTKNQWISASGMDQGTIYTNRGQLPAPFIKLGNGSGEVTVAGNSITIIDYSGPWKWDSKLGIVVSTVVEGNQQASIKYSGNACGTIAKGTVVSSDINFQYWYY